MKNKFHRKVIYCGALVFIKVGQMMPRRALLKFASFGGKTVYRLLKKEREKTIRHLTRVFKDSKSPEEIDSIARKVFVNLGKSLVDWLYFGEMGEQGLRDVGDIEGMEKVEKVLSRGKGIIILTSHIGNWEYLAAYIGQVIGRGTVIARRVYVDKYNKILKDLRKKNNVETIYSDSSPKEILKTLKDNGVIGILPDQDIRHLAGVFIEFLGAMAYTPIAPVTIARASGAGLVPIYVIRQEDDRYKIFVEDEMVLQETGDKKKDVYDNTLKWSRITERYIMKYPEQWVWMHDRWKTKESDIMKGKKSGSEAGIKSN